MCKYAVSYIVTNVLTVSERWLALLMSSH